MGPRAHKRVAGIILYVCLAKGNRAEIIPRPSQQDKPWWRVRDAWPHARAGPGQSCARRCTTSTHTTPSRRCSTATAPCVFTRAPSSSGRACMSSYCVEPISTLNQSKYCECFPRADHEHCVPLPCLQGGGDDEAPGSHPQSVLDPASVNRHAARSQKRSRAADPGPSAALLFPSQPRCALRLIPFQPQIFRLPRPRGHFETACAVRGGRCATQRAADSSTLRRRLGLPPRPTRRWPVSALCCTRLASSWRGTMCNRGSSTSVRASRSPRVRRWASNACLPRMSSSSTGALPLGP
jgi:hypothetical protein